MRDLVLSGILWLRVLGLPESATLRLVYFSLTRLHPKDAESRTSKFGLSNRVRSDGGGSQALYAFFTMALASATGLKYIHRPFQVVAHAPGSPTLWADRWNQQFNFGRFFGSSKPVMVYSLSSRAHVLQALFSADDQVALTSNLVRLITDRHPEILEASRPMLRAVYGSGSMTGDHTRYDTLFHLRRGDVTSSTHLSRFTSASEIERDIEALTAKGAIQRDDVAILVAENLIGEDAALCEKFRVLTVADAFESLRMMVHAPTLVTAVSSFSYLAALISVERVIYRCFWHPPMANWSSLED